MRPLMQFILKEELESHPERDAIKEKKSAELGQKLLEKLWKEEPEPATLWEKLKSVLSDEVDLSQQLFDRMTAFRAHQKLNKKQDMQSVMNYATKAFNKGTEILSSACYLFYHNSQAFEKYATSSFDFQSDIRQSTFEANASMPILVLDQSEPEEVRVTNQHLPLLSFAPIKYGQHPCLTESKRAVEYYYQMLAEPALYGFKTNPYRYEPFIKLLSLKQPESHYPATQHQAIAIAINAFNKCLENEPVKLCARKGKLPFANKQKTC